MAAICDLVCRERLLSYGNISEVSFIAFLIVAGARRLCAEVEGNCGNLCVVLAPRQSRPDVRHHIVLVIVHQLA
jgi:hypothetical protein